jgi:hypothetical protein
MELERAGEIDERMWPCHALEINPRLHIYGCFKYTSFAIHMVLYLPLVEYGVGVVLVTSYYGAVVVKSYYVLHISTCEKINKENISIL